MFYRWQPFCTNSRVLQVLHRGYFEDAHLLFYFITLKPRVEYTKVYAPYVRALLGTASDFCEAFVLKLSTVVK